MFNEKDSKIGLTGSQANFKPPQPFVDFQEDTICLDYSELVFPEDHGAKLNFQKCESVVITRTDIVQLYISGAMGGRKRVLKLSKLTVTLGYPSFFTLGASRPMLMEINDFIDAATRQSDDLAIHQRTNFDRDKQFRGYIAKARCIHEEFRNQDELLRLYSHMDSTNL